MKKNSIRKYYKNIYCLMHDYYVQSSLIEIGDIADSMALAKDANETADPAIWDDWENAVMQVKGSEVVPESLTVEEGYQAAIKFLDFEADLWDSENLKKFVKTLTFEKWLKAVEVVDNDKDESLQR